LRWQPDAHLVGAVARQQLREGAPTAPGALSWSFSFYSPAAGQAQIITANPAGVQPVRQVPVGKAPVPVETGWSLGREELLSIFEAHGGDEFVRGRPHVNLHFRLSGADRGRPADTGRPVWTVSAIDPEARQSFSVAVDALSREVLLAE
jgi:hypothetical protein